MNFWSRISILALSIGAGSTATAQLSQEPAATDSSPAQSASQGASGDVAPAAPVPETIPTIGAAPVESQHSGNRLVEEVIVTAQKRNEDIKDVPISISSFNADYLGAKGVIAQQDLPKITPGLTLSAPVGFATAYIRGIGSDAFILADPLVVTYIDGVYFPSSATQFQDFGSVEKVEIDKGPQGTLFGRNALGGVIAITTQDPSLKGVKASFNGTYTDYTGTDAGRYAATASGYASVPLTDSLGVLVSGLYDRDDPYYDDRVGPTGDHKLIGNGHAWAFRAKVLWKPTENSSIKLNVYRFHEDDPQRNFAVNTQPSAIGGTLGGTHAVIQPQDPYKGGDIDGLPRSSDQGLTYFGSGDLNSHYADIQLLGSYQIGSASRNLDFDSSPLPIAFFDGVNSPPNKLPFFVNNQSAELRLLSNDNAPDWLKLVAGLYYFNQDSGIRAGSFTGGGTDLQDGIIAGVQIPGLQSAIGAASTLIPVIPQGAQLSLGGGLNDRSYAAYTQGTISFTDWVSLTLGARFQEDRRYLLFANQGVNLNDHTQIFIFHYSGINNDHYKGSVNNFNHEDYRTHTSDFDPKVSLNFHVADGWLGTAPLVYVSYQTASTGNVFNAISLFEAPSLAKGSKIDAYEVGLKTTLFNHLLSLDTAAFYYKEKDAQTQVVSVQSGGAVHFENVPGLQTRGADVSILAQILPSLTADGLVLTLSGAYLDSTYTDYRNASGFDESTGVYSSTNDFTGHQVVQAPRYTANAGLNQTLEVYKGTFEAGIDFYYNSGFYFLAQNTPNTKINPYRTLGFTLSYLFDPWKTRVSVFGHNVLNEHYLAARFTNDFGTDDFPAQLSTYGLTLHWDY